MAEALRATDPTAAITYVGRGDGPEARIVPAAGLTFYGMDLPGGGDGGWRGLGPLRLAARLPRAYRRARRLLRALEPDVVVATGGYVCVPVAVAARRRGVPLVVLEQNAHPGRAVRWLAPWAAAVATSFEETARELGRARVTCTGNPVRAAIVEGRAGDAVPARPHRVLVMGGSQGAHRLNTALAAALPELLPARPTLTITHLSGPRDHAELLVRRQQLPAPVRGRWALEPFAVDVGARIAASDLVVMRAGGSSLAEVATIGRPMILVPYPYAGAHQRRNAAPYVAAGAAVSLPDEDCTGPRLAAEIAALLDDPPRWRRMAEASRRCGRPDAAAAVVQLVAGVIAR